MILLDIYDIRCYSSKIKRNKVHGQKKEVWAM